MDWEKILYLESIQNLEKIVSCSHGEKIKPERLLEISTYLQQGRYFFTASTDAPLEIKPLTVYYGVLNFSRALICSRSTDPTLKIQKSHGLTDKTKDDSPIEELEAQIGKSGTFCQLCDTAAKLNKFEYFDPIFTSRSVYCPTASSGQLKGMTISLKDVLGRLYALSDLYFATFDEQPKCLPIEITQANSYLTLEVETQGSFLTKEELILALETYWRRYPFLKKWTLTSAVKSFGNRTRLRFSYLNTDQWANIRENVFKQDNKRPDFMVISRSGVNLSSPPSVYEIPPLMSAPKAITPSLVDPINDQYLSLAPLLFSGAFMLSSLVRYRPQIWTHSLNGKSTEVRGFDDRALAIIKKFVDLTVEQYPELIVSSIGLEDL